MEVLMKMISKQKKLEIRFTVWKQTNVQFDDLREFYLFLELHTSLYQMSRKCRPTSPIKGFKYLNKLKLKKSAFHPFNWSLVQRSNQPPTYRVCSIWTQSGLSHFVYIFSVFSNFEKKVLLNFLFSILEI